MSEMVERVARSMWSAVHWSADMPSFAHEKEWDDEWPTGYETFRALFRDQARAAIEAMREPTEAMRVAIVAAFEDVCVQDGPSVYMDCDGELCVARAMIDAALAEVP